MKKMENKKRIKKIYKFWSGFYDWFMKPWNKYIVKKCEKDLDKFVDKNVKVEVDVLDLACGTGANIERLKKWKLNVKSYLGVDLSTDMQKRAKKKAGWLVDKKFLIADIVKFEPKNKFDIIICTWALSHIDRPADLVKKYRKYLKKGGHMILIFQGEFNRFSFIAGLLKLMNGVFQARLLPRSEIAKFPKGEVLNNTYLSGYLNLIIYKQ